MSYKFSQNAVSSSANEYGNYILKRGAGEIRKPSWQRTETVIRALPCWDFENDCWYPSRCSNAPMDFGDWIRRYDAVRSFGDHSVTFLLYDPVTNPHYDVQGNPCVVLYRAINNAITARQSEPDWPALLKGGAGRRAPLSRPSPIYIVRCGIFRIKNKDMVVDNRSPLGLAPSDPAFFMELPKSAGEKLVGLLEEQVEDYKGDAEDLVNRYRYGDIVSLDKGAYIHIFEEGSDPRANMQSVTDNAPKMLTVSSGARSNISGNNNRGFNVYDLFISPTWNGYGAQLNTPDLEQIVRGKQKPWEDCLQFLSNQEQAHLVQDGFPARAILYAWRDHPEWIKPETRSKAVAKVSVGMDVRDDNTCNNNFDRFSPPKPVKQEVQSNTRVGGWGNASHDDNVGDKSTDDVVPVSLQEAIAQAVMKPEMTVNEKEQSALVALENARKRVVRN